MLEVDQKVIENDLWHLLLLHIHLLGVNFLDALTAFKGRWACSLLFLNLRSNVQNLIDDFEQMISAPLLVVAHDILENPVHFDHHVHLHQLRQLNLPRLDYCSHNFNRKCVEFGVVYLEVLENYVN
jgi:hypothetical protein